MIAEYIYDQQALEDAVCVCSPLYDSRVVYLFDFDFNSLFFSRNYLDTFPFRYRNRYITSLFHYEAPPIISNRMKLATTLAIFLSALVLADNRPFPLIPVIPRPPPGSAPEAHGNTECWP